MALTPEQFTIIGLLIAAGIAGLAKKWVFGWVYDAKVQDLAAMTEDRNFWRDATLEAMGHTGKAIEVAARRKNVP